MVSWVPPGITRKEKRPFCLHPKMSDSSPSVNHTCLHGQTIPYTQRTSAVDYLRVSPKICSSRSSSVAPIRPGLGSASRSA